MPKATKTHRVSGIPIFRVGEWHGFPYTEADLDAIVAAFGKTGYTPPLKPGHRADTGSPALGWVENVYRHGTDLMADFRDVPEKVYNLVKQKAYNALSIELFKNYKRGDTQQEFPLALKAVGLLGAAVPEVAGLYDLSSAFDADGHEYATISLTTELAPVEIMIFMIQKRGDRWVVLDEAGEKVLGEHETEAAAKQQLASIKSQKHMSTEESMTDDEKQRLEAAERAVTELTAKLGAISEQADAHKATAEQFSKDLATERLARRRERIVAEVADLVRQRKVTPAQKDTLVAVFDALPETQTITVVFQKDGKPETETLSLAAGMKRFLSMQPELFAGERLQDGRGIEDEHQAILKYCKENNLDPNKASDYATALVKVCSQKKEG